MGEGYADSQLSASSAHLVTTDKSFSRHSYVILFDTGPPWESTESDGAYSRHVSCPETPCCYLGGVETVYQSHLTAAVLDDSVESWHQRLLQVKAACIGGDVGFW